MKKELLIVIILAVIIVVLLGVLIFVSREKSNPPVGIEGLLITLPEINSEILSPVKITGEVNGSGWAGFEGQVGNVKLLDENDNQLGNIGILTAITDWMTFPVKFQAYIQFSSDRDQDGKLVFVNENPSDMRQYDRQFTLPVKIKKSSGELTKVKVFFNNNAMDPEVSCNKVFPIEREVPKTPAIARVALTELLGGLTSMEENAGFSTSINKGVKIQSLTIDNGVAIADFDGQLEYQVGGSCKVSAIRAQITETLKQFPTVSSVIISINGNAEDVLQP